HLEDKALADLAGGVVPGVLLLAEVPCSHERDRDGVAEHHLDRGRSDRREVKGTELSLQWQMHIHVTHGLKRAPFHGRDGNEAGAFRPGAGDEAEELVGGAGLA
ncbi:hypothetical protein PIB30_115631, partial [Stylosanthes scabra]|nr:hypothetical protein [Stylosanthes scabra]